MVYNSWYGTVGPFVFCLQISWYLKNNERCVSPSDIFQKGQGNSMLLHIFVVSLLFWSLYFLKHYAIVCNKGNKFINCDGNALKKDTALKCHPLTDRYQRIKTIDLETRSLRLHLTLSLFFISIGLSYLLLWYLLIYVSAVGH